MMKVPKEMIIDKIKEKTDLSESEINSKIKEKLKQLSGLISEEGAAHIVANQLGVKILEETGKLQVKNVLPGMRKVDIVGKVLRTYEVREFEKENRKGKVGSFLLGDETGVIRVVCWNDKTDFIDKLNQDMLVKIESGYARENRNGRKEIHISNQGAIVIEPEDEEDIKVSSQANRKKISELAEDDQNVEILGTVVQVFDPRFFEVCPECSKRARERDDGYYCETHNKVDPNYSYVLNLFVDDGSENIRVVLWRNQVKNLLDKTHEEIIELKDSSFEDIKDDLLGKIIKFVGRTSKNEMFNRLEFIAQLVFTNPDPEEEIKRLTKEAEEEKVEEVSIEKEEQEDESLDQEESESMTEEKVEATVQDESEDTKEEKIKTESLEKKKDLSEEELLSLEDLEDL
jgi:replication factor A1